MLTQNLHLMKLKYHIMKALRVIVCSTTLLINIKVRNEIVDI